MRRAVRKTSSESLSAGIGRRLFQYNLANTNGSQSSSVSELPAISYLHLLFSKVNGFKKTGLTIQSTRRLIQVSPNGWTDNSITLKWIQHFDRYTASQTKTAFRGCVKVPIRCRLTMIFVLWKTRLPSFSTNASLCSQISMVYTLKLKLEPNRNTNMANLLW